MPFVHTSNTGVYPPEAVKNPDMADTAKTLIWRPNIGDSQVSFALTFNATYTLQSISMKCPLFNGGIF